MPLEVIYVVRHGFRSNWLVNPTTGDYKASIPSPTGISSDPALTAHGVDQARELGAHLMTVDPPIDAVYSSPYYRCLQTITPFVDLKVQDLERRQAEGGSTPLQGEAARLIRPETGIAEWYGSAPFDHPTPASGEVLKGMFSRYDERYRTAVIPAVKGETVDELYARLANAVGAIIDQCDAEGHRAIILCSHAAPIIALGRVLTGKVPSSVDVEDFDAFTCGLSVFRRRQASPDNGPEFWKDGRGVRGGWDCAVNSDCSFLSKGEERGWRFSGDESFHKTETTSQDDAGIALGVVVEGRGKQSRSTPGAHHL
ncbi:transcription factor tau 55 kDa subunit [Plectosphaerella plurivora]|uniref:Transcription factor tau 55 kDa subunit n=1 Tax=Plectosphaerella plurivora TaxID=936078 RepID=A0A9P8VCH9_9PEZI|nr:transcription factor tau 55 kDa subunit [Plectosphaerella plurivora]